MIKYVFFCTLFSATTFFSCKNTTTPPPAVPIANTEVETKSSIPDPGDLLKTLQGRWKSEQDSTYTLEISDTQMNHFNSGKLTYQSIIDVDGACESSVCKLDGVDTSDGWCFTEIMVEDGKQVAQCNFVIFCDTNKFQYRSLIGTGSGLSFKKIK